MGLRRRSSRRGRVPGNLGDRLVYSNGVVVLTPTVAGLIWIFHADLEALIHLYVIGVFTAFTLLRPGSSLATTRAAHRQSRQPSW